MSDVNKVRLDQLLVDLGFFESRNKASTCIMSNGVKLSGKLLNKPGHQINPSKFYREYETNPKILEVNDTMLEYVSRGAYKLKAADEAWRLDFTNKAVMDIGASTGGFTEYVLKQGAKQVIAIDVGKGQLHYKLRNDSRVINLEETNFRNIELQTINRHWERSEAIFQVVIDVSFISLITILEKLKSLIQDDKEKKYFDPNLQIIALIKPQFEAGKEIMDKCQGVLKDSQIRDQVLHTTSSKIQELGFKQKGLIESPIHGAKGNIEYLALLSWQ
jgi:23S rRNA (cytidine1920-2'-O)/16S rRNA (cytidine1409-2'-O)-methyltransferase